jgi:hypothetical protein
MTAEVTTDQASQFEATIPVTVNINVRDLLNAGTGRGYDYDSGQEYSTGNLSRDVTKMVAGIIARELSPQIRDSIRAEIDTQVGTAITAALDGEFQPTDTYGSPRGEKTTLRAEVVKTAQEWLAKPVKNGSYNSSKTNLDQYLTETVDRAIRKELDAAVKDAKEQVLGRVKDQAAEVIAKTVTGLAGVR